MTYITGNNPAHARIIRFRQNLYRLHSRCWSRISIAAARITFDALSPFRSHLPDSPKAYHGAATPKLFEHSCLFRFSHQLRIGGRTVWWDEWWATKDLNLGPLPCEGSALTTELVAHAAQHFRG